ncbi:MAG TPA: recombinase family protein, partial [Dehalococcoidia bacterium]|nr:recombinase family protein [Dehalococcoidia bacterium]
YFQLTTLGVKVVQMSDGSDLGARLLQFWSQRNQNGLRERVRAAMQQKAVRGEVLGRPPYGYKVGPNRRLQIMPEEGAVIRFIFKLYLKDGLGIRRIARRLNEEGITTRSGGPWNMVTVRDILRNRAYVGTYHRFGVRVPASHAPLISAADFQKVQERLDQRRPANLERQSIPFLLSGLVYCGNCGNRMIGVTRKQRWQRKSDGSVQSAQYRYYQCESRANRNPCSYQTRRAAGLEAEILTKLVNGVSNIKTGEEKELSAQLADTEAQILRLREKVRRLDKRLGEYMDAVNSGRLSEERFQATAVKLAQEQLATEEELAATVRMAEQKVSEAEKKKQREQAFTRLRDEWARLSAGERQELLRELIDRVIIERDATQVILRS